MARHYDLAVIGAGIVGLAQALAAARRGKRVIVLERDHRAVGASVRNFGFVTVTGQQRGKCLQRARRSAAIWDEVAEAADIPVVHRGLMLAARSPEALAVIEAFAADPDLGDGCALLDRAAAAERCPMLRREGLRGALWSPHERRVDPRLAIPRLTGFLERRHGVELRFGCAVREVAPPRIETAAGPVEAEACIVCPGADFQSLFRDRIAGFGLTKCKLHMLRLAPQPAGWRLPGGVMSDSSLVRYLGYAELPEAAAMAARLEAERPDLLARGIHLIVTQDEDGGLVVGDSHHYDDPPDPFDDATVDPTMLALAQEVLDIPEPRVVERWTGVYPSAGDRLALIDAPSDAVRLVLVTSGTGMSTAFAIGEEAVAGLYGNA